MGMPLDALKGLVVVAFEKEPINFKVKTDHVLFDLKGKTLKVDSNLEVVCLSDSGWKTTLASMLVSSVLKRTLKSLQHA